MIVYYDISHVTKEAYTNSLHFPPDLCTFLKNIYCYSITVVCLFSPSLHPTPAEPTSLPQLHPHPWFCPCVLYSSSYNPLSPLSPSPPHSFLNGQVPSLCSWARPDWTQCAFCKFILFGIRGTRKVCLQFSRKPIHYLEKINSKLLFCVW